MSGTLNKVMLIGRLGDDVKMVYFEGGGSIGRFPIATDESYVNRQTGERVENTEWHNIVVRNKGAELCEKYLKKGDRVYIEGRIKTRQWQDESGQARYTTEIQATDFKFLTSRQESGQGAAQNQQPAATTSTPQAKPTPQPPKPESNLQEQDDDLPF